MRTLFCAQRSITKVFSTALFHGHARKESSRSSPASNPWFIKVVCTLCFHHSDSLSVFDSDYFRENMNPYVAFSTVYHINNRLNSPDLAYRFFCFSRLNFNLIHLESTFDSLLRSLCQIGIHDSAKVVFECMKADGILPNSSILDFLISSFANAGKFKIAEEILIGIGEFYKEKEERVSPVVYNNFLTVLVNGHRVDEAVLIFRGYILRLRSFCPDVCSFNIIIRGLCRVRKIEEAFEFFDVMKSFCCHPDRVTYNTLLNGLCKVGRVDRAEELLGELKAQSGLSPDVVTYTSVISGFCKSGRTETAAAVLDEMIDNGVTPNLITFNVIIDGFGKNGEVALALKMYERMTVVGLLPDVVTFTSIIDGHCRIGELEQAMKIWDEMNEKNIRPNVFTFSILISSLCKENKLNEARDLLRQLIWRGDIVPQPFIYNPVLDGFCKAGNVDEANAIVSEIEAKGCIHDKMTFTILILGLCMKGRMSEAIEMYHKMLRVGCAPDNITISSLISCLRKAGMAREANEIEQKASNHVHSDSLPRDIVVPVRTKMKITVAV